MSFSSKIFPKISFVIPTYNAESTIFDTLDSIIESTSLPFEIIIVDDCSKDSTVLRVKKYLQTHSSNNIKLVELEKNVGPGKARNIGMKQVTGEYTLFFDSDDLMNQGVIDEAIIYLDSYQTDVGFFKYDIINDQVQSQGMWESDTNIFYHYLYHYPIYTSINNLPEMLYFTNYPWNKILRTSYLKKIDFKFSELRLHEDILAHWMILMNAQSIKIFDKAICRYFLKENGDNATSNKSQLRLQAVDALHELYSYIKEKNVELFVSGVFVRFSLDLIWWVNSVIDNEYKKELLNNFKELLLSIDPKDLLYILNDENLHYQHQRITNILINNEII